MCGCIDIKITHVQDTMSYEPGVLVRRQQREYPPELRREIALAALEVGNNREVARLYSERLGYTVNESTVRGIKKRYLEGVHKGKIDSPGLSPRSGGDSNHGDGDKDSDGEAGEMDTSFHADNVMKLQIDVLEGGCLSEVCQVQIRLTNGGNVTLLSHSSCHKSAGIELDVLFPTND